MGERVWSHSLIHIHLEPQNVALFGKRSLQVSFIMGLEMKPSEV